MPQFHVEAPENITTGFIADAVIRYLEDPDKKTDQAVLAESMSRFRRTFIKQFMLPRADRKGVESCTSYSPPCARKARFVFDGVERPLLMAKTALKFFLGDIVELSVLALAKQAGLDLNMNNEDLTIQGRDLKLIPVHPDGLLTLAREQSLAVQFYNVEIKSCDSHTFDRWLEQGGPDDTWGYLTQASVEVQAWRETMLEVNQTIFVAVSTGTRQGSVADWLISYDQSLVEAWHDRRELVHGLEVPPIPFELAPEINFVRGATEPEWDPAISELPPFPRVERY